MSLKLSRPGTMIIADNVVRDGKVVDPDNPDPNIQGVRQFTELVAAEPRLSATVLQTVGSKGYDGFAIAIVNCPLPTKSRADLGLDKSVTFPAIAKVRENGSIRVSSAHSPNHWIACECWRSSSNKETCRC